MGRRRWRRNGVRAVGPRRGWEGEGGGEGGSVAPPPPPQPLPFSEFRDPWRTTGSPPFPYVSTLLRRRRQRRRQGRRGNSGGGGNFRDDLRKLLLSHGLSSDRNDVDSQPDTGDIWRRWGRGTLIYRTPSSEGGWGGWGGGGSIRIARQRLLKLFKREVTYKDT